MSLITPSLTVRSNPNPHLLPDDNKGLWVAGVSIAIAGGLAYYFGRKVSDGVAEAEQGDASRTAAQVKARSFSPDPGVTCYRYYSQLSCVKN